MSPLEERYVRIETTNGKANKVTTPSASPIIHGPLRGFGRCVRMPAHPNGGVISRRGSRPGTPGPGP